jgi:tetratricopeptide (TPR) repeat protein
MSNVLLEINKLKQQINTKNTNENIDLFKKIAYNYESINEYNKAIKYYNKILQNTLNPPIYWWIMTRIGQCYYKLKDFNTSINYFDFILKNTKVPEVAIQLAECYCNVKKYKKSIEILLNILKKITDKKHNDSINFTLANMYYYIKDYNNSIKYYHKTTNTNLTYNSSFPYLALKQFERGYKLYESRLNNNNICPHTNQNQRVDIPFIKMWNGSSNCNHLLIIYEQGIGDNIQYFKYIIELSENNPNMKITYFCKDIISHLFDCDKYPNIHIVLQISNLENYNYKLYIMSLPFILKKTTIDVNKINYLKINEDKNQKWKQEIIKYNKNIIQKKKIIGITFNGLLTSFIDKQLTIQNISELFELDAEFIILHKETEVIIDSTIKNKYFNFHTYNIDDDVPFEDTIAILNNIDLFITIDTSVAHIAGVIGVNTWLLLGYGSDWRWFNHDTKCEWYDSVSYIRLRENIEFSNIISKTKNKLKQYIKL